MDALDRSKRLLMPPAFAIWSMIPPNPGGSVPRRKALSTAAVLLLASTIIPGWWGGSAVFRLAGPQAAMPRLNKRSDSFVAGDSKRWRQVGRAMRYLEP